MAVLMVVVDLALLLGLTLRLTRFVVLDDLGRWWLRAPAQAWALRHEPPPEPPSSGTYGFTMSPYGTPSPMPSAQTYTSRGYAAELALRREEEMAADPSGWRSKMVSGLDCPYCVGFWISGLCLLSLLLAGGPGDAHWVWRVVAGWFALNWVAAHLAVWTGDT